MVGRWLCNFVWSDDIYTKKLVIVDWAKVCTLTSEGGLGLISIKAINKAAMLKLSWDLFHSTCQWVALLHARFIRNNAPVRYHISSSIHPALHCHLQIV